MTPLLTRMMLVTTLTVVVGLAVPAVAQDADILGTWDVIVATPQGQSTSAPLVLKKEGDKIVGTFSSPQGDQPVEATAKEKVVTIWFTVRTRNGPTAIMMNGTMDGTEMKGTMDFGSRGQGQWAARRRPAPAVTTQVAEPAVDVTGTWAFQVDSAAGSGTPTMTFKQEGEKLSGQYTGQLGEAPLTGTVKGTAVEFAFDVTIEANTLHIVYAGTAEKDSMKGTMKLGDFGQGTFTATKKN